jgi:hypothetical protein
MPTTDRVADAIEEMIRAQRRNGQHDAQWTPIKPGRCCLCGSSGMTLGDDLALAEAILTRWIAGQPERQKLLRKLGRRVHDRVSVQR